jgi:hypothetical protein
VQGAQRTERRDDDLLRDRDVDCFNFESSMPSLLVLRSCKLEADLNRLIALDVLLADGSVAGAVDPVHRWLRQLLLTACRQTVPL